MSKPTASIWRIIRRALLVLTFLIVLPIASGGAWFYAQGWPSNWRTADWSSSGVAVDTATLDEAVVQIYAARAGRWKSVFAVHSWLVVKRAGEETYTRYEVVGWGTPVRRDAYPIDGKWYSNVPDVAFELRGADATAAIPQIVAAISRYPNNERGSYTVWPGPNSNTFIAWLGREVPDLGMELPPTAIGKDYLGDGFNLARTISGTGWQVSWSGVVGAAIGVREGLELHVLGSTIGLDFDSLSLKLPSIGTIGPKEIADLFGSINSSFAASR